MIAITTPLESRYYGIYDNSGVWTQANALNTATNFAVLDAIPTIAGTYSGTVYDEGDTVDPFSMETELYFNPLYVDTYTGNVTISGETVEDGELSGIGHFSGSTTEDNGTDLYLNENDDGTYSIIVDSYKLKRENSFRTLILSLLFTDGRADQYLVANAKNRRGWVEDDSFVSLMWLLDQKRLNQDVVNKAISFAKSALQYMLVNGICSTLEVSGEIISRRGIKLEIAFTVGNSVIKEYVNIWRNLT